MRGLIVASRVILGLVLIAAVVAGAAFFSDHPGRVEIVWQGWQIDTSVGVLAVVVVLVVMLGSLLVTLAGALRRTPRNFRRRREARRRGRGEAALTSAVVALAAGQAAEARLAARRAETLLDGAPVALLLVAEAAQRLGETAAARRAYTALLERPESEFLGLRGLIGQALRAGEDDTALRLAERARRLRPDARWLVESLLVLEARAGDWQAARDTLAVAARRRSLPEERARHHQGVVLYELSLARERDGAAREAASLAGRAQALAADLAGPACHHARLLNALGRRRAAAKAIERAWRTAPHPDLARLYLEIDPEATPLGRAAALQRLAAHNRDATESHLAIAEAALAARLWGEARRHLGLVAMSSPDAAPAAPSRRLCLLMARLEESENGDAAASRQWIDRALGASPDPCYVCSHCAAESAQWLVLCPECGGFDTLQWSAPRVQRPAVAASADASTPLMLPGLEAPARPSPPSGLAAAPQSDK